MPYYRNGYYRRRGKGNYRRRNVRSKSKKRVTKKKRVSGQKKRIARARVMPFRDAAYAPMMPFVGTSPGQLLPPKKVVKMKYACPVALRTTGNGPAVATQSMRTSIPTTYRFNLNSIYDPDLSGVGHQPYTHDSWESLYSQYTVKGARFNLLFKSSGYNPGSANGIMVGYAIRRDAGRSVTGDNVTVWELPQAVYDMLGNTDSAGVQKEFVGTYSWNDWFEKTDRTGQTVVFGTSPFETVELEIFAAAADDDPTPAEQKVLVWVTIEYLVELSEPKNPAFS